MSNRNKYLEKIAALNPTAKIFARKVMEGLSGKPRSAVNNVFNKTHGAVSKSMSGVFSNAEKTSVISQVGSKADMALGKGKLYPFEATRAARAGARLARMQSKV